MDEKTIGTQEIQEHVRKKYGEAALRVLSNQPIRCCGSSVSEEKESCCGNATREMSGDTCCSSAGVESKTVDPITSNLYSPDQIDQIPESAILASLGCGNPTALAQLKEGEIVLDLGSGGGIDVILSAKRVGESGFAYGLDMTDEMLRLAEQNAKEANIPNVKFLKGNIESIPLPDNSVDVIISNCVINLSADKDLVLKEAFRVLRPGGRFAVSDVVVDGDLPQAVRKNMEMYVGCVAGALEHHDYVRKLMNAGFTEASIEPVRRYEFSKLEGAWAPQGVASMTQAEKEALDGKIWGGFIRAVKPS